MLVRIPVICALLLALATIGAAAGHTAALSDGLPTSWAAVSRGPSGGTVWEGRIPDAFAPWDHRAGAVYLPPQYNAGQPYPVIYLLHGMAGSPSSYVDALHIAAVSDQLISSGQVQPFIAVMPVAGPVRNPDSGEWAGIWEDYVIRGVVPWVDAHLSTIANPQGRALEGLCAGGFGALDIGLRHPGTFGTLGSWEGYFAPVFPDGPFANATPAYLAAHNPTLLLRKDATALRSQHVQFYISVGGNHGHVRRAWSLQFAKELIAAHVPHELWLLPSSDRGHFWSATLPSAVTYAADHFRS